MLIRALDRFFRHEAAGGIVTDWSGGPAMDGGRAVAAANPQVHEAALRALAWTGA